MSQAGLRAVELTGTAAPKAVYANAPASAYHAGSDRTYSAYLGLGRDLYATYWDHATDTPGTPVLVDTRSSSLSIFDNHSAPSLCIDNSGFIHMVWRSHNTPHRHVVSDAPLDISAWTVQDLPTDGTYPIIRCDPASGNLYIFDRAGDDHTGGFPVHAYGSIRKSVDGGATWSAAAIAFDTTGAPEATTDFYPLIGMEWGPDGLLHIGWTVARGSGHDDSRENIYHAKFDPATDTFAAADGTALGAIIDWADHAACLASTRSDVTEGFLAVDAANEVTMTYSAPQSGDRFHHAVRWNGTAWADIDPGIDAPDAAGLQLPFYRDNTLYGLFTTAVGADVELWRWTNGWVNLGTVLTQTVGLGWDRIAPVTDGFAVAMQARSTADTQATASDLMPIAMLVDALPSAAFDDDFVGNDGDSWDVLLWSQDAGSGGGATTIQSNRGQASGSNGNANSGGRGKGKQGQVANQEMTGSFQLCETDEPCNGALWLQTSDDWAGLDWPTEGYGVRLPSDSDTATLLRASGGVVATLDSTTWPRDIGLKQFRFRRQSNKVRFRIWDDGDAEPETWMLVADDDVITPEAVGAFQVAYTCPTAPSVDACASFDDVATTSNDDPVTPAPSPSTGGCGFDGGFSTGFAVVAFCESPASGNRMDGTGAIRRSPTPSRAAR